MRPPRPRRAGLALGLALALGLGAAVPACDPRAAADESSLDEATMALLGQARALHHQADVFESGGQYDRATAAIERVLALPFPRGMREAEDVRADAWGRLAELALASRDPDAALARANTGLADATADTVFRARLHMVRGQALSALAERLATTDPAASRQRREEALEALETSIQVNQRVLSRLTDAGR